MHNLYRQSPTVENREADIIARNQYNQIISEAKNTFDSHIQSKVMACSNGSKSFWSLAKSIQNNFCKTSFPPLLSNDQIISTAKGKAELFAKQFAENSTLNPPPNMALPSINNCNFIMHDLKFKVKSVRHILCNLDCSKASGLDGIPAIVLKKCAPELAPVLTRLFQISYDSGIFPSCWKTARVQPIPKKGSKTLPNNYRPVSLLSIVSKVMEKYLNVEILKYLELNKLIHDRQYGFRNRRSTADLLSFVTHTWNKSLEFHGECQIVALDISKAFDQVWHAALLNKLPSYGLPPKFCSWVSSFLTNRSISVVVDGQSSDLHCINAGVPQGSVLAPTLFLLHINDLLSCTANPIHSYADDSTLHSNFQTAKPVSSAELNVFRKLAQESLSQDLERILKWGDANLVKFNASKTQSCSLSHKPSPNPHLVRMQNEDLAYLESFSLVGVALDQNLLWRGHINSLAESAAKKLGYLFRARKYFSSANLLSLYKSQVRPTIEYCSHIWGAAAPSNLLVLDAIERRALRLIGDLDLTNGLTSLAHRRLVGDLCLFYRYFQGFCSDELASIIPPLAAHNRTTRATENIHKHVVHTYRSRTDHFSRSFVPRVSKFWNALPESVFPTPPNLQIFKKRINKHLLSHPPAPTVR